jgi:hypothetical protein
VVSGLEISVAKSSSDGTIRTFVSFRILGDNLLPDEITDAMGLYPTEAHGKGYNFKLEKSPSDIKARTGVWYFDTEKLVSSQKLIDHTNFLVSTLCPEGTFFGMLSPVTPTAEPHPRLIKILRLRNILQKRELYAVAGFFWHGVAGARHPSIPKPVHQLFRSVPIEIEQDFEAEEGRHVA